MEKYQKHLEMGLYALQSNNNEVASVHFMKAYEINPNPISAYAYANELFKRNNFTEVVKILFDSVSSGTQTASAVCVYTRALSLLGKYNDAIEILSEYQAKDPHNTIYILTKAEIALNHKKFNQVKETIEEAITSHLSIDLINQIKSRLYHIKGLEKAQKEQWKDAEQLFKQAIELDQNWAGPLINLGSIQEIKGNPKEAYQTFKTAYNKDSNNPVLLYNLSKISIKSGKKFQAEKYFNKLKLISPDYPGIKQVEQMLKA